MNRPYVICHMMMSIEACIDCAMTAQLEGTKEYYETLDEINCGAKISRRNTAELEMALPGKFVPKNKEKIGKNDFSKKVDSNDYDVVIDTKGQLLWNNASEYEKPMIIITSQEATKEYLNYLDERNISRIVSGEKIVDLNTALEVLKGKFNVERVAIVGGPNINTSFLSSGLLDEISLLIGTGIDARKGMPTVFDNLPSNHDVIKLKLLDVRKYDDGALCLRYKL